MLKCQSAVISKTHLCCEKGKSFHGIMRNNPSTRPKSSECLYLNEGGGGSFFGAQHRTLAKLNAGSDCELNVLDCDGLSGLGQKRAAVDRSIQTPASIERR